MIARYMAANPRVIVELELTSRRVDFIGERIDVALLVRFPLIEPDANFGRKRAAYGPSPKLIDDLALPLLVVSYLSSAAHSRLAKNAAH